MRVRRIVIGLGLGLIAATLGGCRQTLFAGDYPDTQFESYDRTRNRFVPEYERDAFGKRRPALRARLMPDD